MGRKTRKGERSASPIRVSEYLDIASWSACGVQAKSEVGVAFGLQYFPKMIVSANCVFILYS